MPLLAMVAAIPATGNSFQCITRNMTAYLAPHLWVWQNFCILNLLNETFCFTTKGALNEIIRTFTRRTIRKRVCIRS